MYWFWTSNAQVELWNDINLWRYLGGFLTIARTFEFRKRNSIEKFSVGVTVEVDNQRNCLVMCVNSSGILIEIVTHMNILRVPISGYLKVSSIAWRTASTLLCHCSTGQIYILVQCKALFNKWLSRRRRCNRDKIRRTLIKDWYSTFEDVESWRGVPGVRCKLQTL